MVAQGVLFTGFFVTAPALLAVMPFVGLLRDGPQSGAATEIPGRLLLPQAAAARNSQNDRMFRMTEYFRMQHITL